MHRQLGREIAVVEPEATARDSDASESFAETLSDTLFLSARLIGQLSLASCANVSKVFASIPGTLPRRSSADFVTVHASPTFSNVTVAVTSSCSGGVLFRPSAALSAIAKQLACAAARSSSGLVWPSGASVRAAHETGRSLNLRLEIALTVPLPLVSSPFQIALA